MYQIVYFKYNHIQPADVADFRHVDVIISSVRYFSMKNVYYILEV